MNLLALQEWYSTPLGKAVFEAVQQKADELLNHAFGYYLVQVGFNSDFYLYKQCTIRNKFMYCTTMQLGMTPQSVIGLPHELPFESNSLDVIILHHTLDYADHPHQALREATRVLRPGGQMLLVHFNPNSFWSLCRLFHPKQQPWQSKGYSYGRLIDWMNLMELSELKHTSVFHQLPLENERWRYRFSFIERGLLKLPAPCGVVLMMLARKDVQGCTPLKLNWRQRKIMTIPLVKPSIKQLNKIEVKN